MQVQKINSSEINFQTKNTYLKQAQKANSIREARIASKKHYDALSRLYNIKSINTERKIYEIAESESFSFGKFMTLISLPFKRLHEKFMYFVFSN